jgi:hypothetical protein
MEEYKSKTDQELGESNYFELHIGFPVNDESAAMTVLETMQKKRPGWVHPEVYNVENKERQGWVHSEVSDVRSYTEELDPHNVPGILGYLVSLDFRSNSDQIAAEVLAETRYVLSELSRLDIKNARLEIENVFGFLTVTFAEDGSAEPSARVFQTASLPENKLVFKGAERIPETPNSEIHFIIEKFRGSHSQASQLPSITNDLAVEILTKYGIKVRQTIQYRSQAMRAAKRVDKKLIATSYYDSPQEAEKAAYELLDKHALFREFKTLGYRLRLVVERILGCFKPTPIHENEDSLLETLEV